MIRDWSLQVEQLWKMDAWRTGAGVSDARHIYVVP